MIEHSNFRRWWRRVQACSPPNEMLPLVHLRQAMGRWLEVREIFARFQNLSLRVLIEDLRRGRCTRGDWGGGTWPSLSETRRSRLGETRPRECVDAVHIRLVRMERKMAGKLERRRCSCAPSTLRGWIAKIAAAWATKVNSLAQSCAAPAVDLLLHPHKADGGIPL